MSQELHVLSLHSGATCTVLAVGAQFCSCAEVMLWPFLANVNVRAMNNGPIRARLIAT